MSFECKLCKFISLNKFNYHRHLTTKKHSNNEKADSNSLDIEVYENKPNITQNEPKMNQNEPKMNQKEPKMNQNEPVNLEDLNCQYCNKSFNTEPSKRRHELHRCKENQDIILKNGRRINIKNKKKLVKLIENLFDKHAGNGSSKRPMRR